MNETRVIEILDRLRDRVQAMREEGEQDLRTVLAFVADARREAMAVPCHLCGRWECQH